MSPQDTRTRYSRLSLVLTLILKVPCQAAEAFFGAAWRPTVGTGTLSPRDVCALSQGCIEWVCNACPAGPGAAACAYWCLGGVQHGPDEQAGWNQQALLQFLPPPSW